MKPTLELELRVPFNQAARSKVRPPMPTKLPAHSRALFAKAMTETKEISIAAMVAASTRRARKS